VLARPIFAPVEGAFRTAPNILAHPAVDFVFGFGTLRHACPFKALRRKK
jgi:hypothetical protein